MFLTPALPRGHDHRGARLGLRPAVAAVGYRRCPAPTRQSAD